MATRHDLTRAEILRHALQIMEDYEADDMKLTLRQMYYQFVSLGICPSGQVHYKRIGDVLTDADVRARMQEPAWITRVFGGM